MIYTITANPSLDYYMFFDKLHLGEMNRAHETHLVPGGKGINVAMMLTRLGLPCCALGFIGGSVGVHISRLLDERGCTYHFIDLPGMQSRVNVKLYAEGETECNAPGPPVSQEALQKLLQNIENMNRGDVLVIGGALPRETLPEYYAHLLHAANKHGIPTVVDACGEPLRAVLPEHPWLVKPNVLELQELIGKPLDSIESICEAAHVLQARGARNVLVSLGSNGALLLTAEGELWHGVPPAGIPCSTVGAGDSMVAGFLTGWWRTGNDLDALRMALATGSATVFSNWLAEAEEVEYCLQTLPALRKIEA